MSIVLCLFGGIVFVLGALHVHVPLALSHIPAIGFFVSLPWIFVCWKLIQSAEKVILVVIKKLNDRLDCIAFLLISSTLTLLF